MEDLESFKSRTSFSAPQNESKVAPARVRHSFVSKSRHIYFSRFTSKENQELKKLIRGFKARERPVGYHFLAPSMEPKKFPILFFPGNPIISTAYLWIARAWADEGHPVYVFEFNPRGEDLAVRANWNARLRQFQTVFSQINPTGDVGLAGHSYGCGTSIQVLPYLRRSGVEVRGLLSISPGWAAGNRLRRQEFFPAGIPQTILLGENENPRIIRFWKKFSDRTQTRVSLLPAGEHNDIAQILTLSKSARIFQPPSPQRQQRLLDASLKFWSRLLRASSKL